MKPLDQRKQDLADVQYRINEWAEVKRHAAWGWLVQYLEERYVELGTKKCESLKDLSARNASMSEIKGIFQHIQHTMNEREALLNDIRTYQQDEDELPDKFMNAMPVNF